jgi:hypothetical protein
MLKESNADSRHDGPRTSTKRGEARPTEKPLTKDIAQHDHRELVHLYEQKNEATCQNLTGSKHPARHPKNRTRRL